MRRVSTATCTSGDPVSPSWVRCSRIVSTLFSTTANFFFLLFFSVSQPVQRHMLPHAANRIVRDPARLFDVPRYLRSQLVHAREPLLRPYPPHEAHIHDETVQVPLEIEKMSLDATLAPLEGRGHPDVGGGRV